MIGRLWPWLRSAIAAGILAVLIWRLGTDAFLDGLRMINPSAIVLALGIGLLTTVCSAWRWCLIAGNLGLRLNLGVAVSDYYRSLLLNAVLPAGVLGDVHRAVSHGKRSGNVGRGVRAVVLERFAGQAVLLAVGAAMVLLQSDVVAAIIPGRAVAIALGCLLASVVVVVAWQRWGPAAGRRALAGVLADSRAGLLARETLPGVLILSVATVAGHVAMFLVAVRVVGLSAPIAQVAPLLVLALVVMAVPVNIGGWGPREGFLALAFGAAGLGSTEGLTVSVVYGVLTFVASLPGVLALFPRAGQESKIAKYREKVETRLASRSLPFSAEAREGRPMTPESV